MLGPMRLGIAHHLGWAVAVVADAEHRVMDRRRIELVSEGLPAAPIHHEGGPHEMHRTGPPLTDDELADLVARVRASAAATASAELDRLLETVAEPIESLSVRDWPEDFPTDIPTLRRVPYESRADSVLYCQVLAGLAAERGWAVHRFDAKTVERDATRVLGTRADEVLTGPRKALGPPWAKDHRLALAATVLAAASSAG